MPAVSATADYELMKAVVRPSHLWSRLFPSKSVRPSFKASDETLAVPITLEANHTARAVDPLEFSPIPRRSPLMPQVCEPCRSQLFSFEGFRKSISDFHDASTGYCYSTTWRDIYRSMADESCPWCSILIQARNNLPTSRFPLDPADALELRIQTTISPQVDWTDVTNTIRCYINGYAVVSYSIYADKNDLSAVEIGTGLHVREEEPYVDYRSALDCIAECRNHEHCPAVAETYLPTRVIDCFDPAKPRLVETQRQVKAHYCTLSYVWGGEQHQKTTTRNLDNYVREGINISLPQTITDAIVVTHNLGIRYLWVDALCIVQDSGEDKTKELADMAHIYRDSYATISVLSAYRADAGFLPDEQPTVELPYHGADGSASRMFLRHIIPRQSRFRGHKHQVVELHSPLDQRGWCFQESILSPRKLIFQPPHVRYECRTWSKDLTRQSPTDFLPQEPHRVDEYTLHPLSETDGRTIGSDDNGQLFDLWCGMLSEYSRRKISVPTDKLVAFSSVAEEFQLLMRDDYLAGLWRRGLVDNLLWHIFREPDEALPQRPQEYRAPTWSWASVDGMVMPYRNHMFEIPSTEYEAEILSCEVTPKSSVHALGEILDAKLTMKVKIVPLMPNGKKGEFIERKGTVHEGLFERLSLGGAWVLPVGNCLEPQSSSQDAESTQKRLEIQFDCLEGTTRDCNMDFHVVMLRAGRRWGNQDGYKDEGWMRGLLVLAVNSRIEQYRRVAMLNLWKWNWPDWVEATPLKEITLI